MIQLIDFKSPLPQGLVLCPTWELCIQITRDLTGFVRYLSGPRIVAVYVGASIADQNRQIKKGAQIIVAITRLICDRSGIASSHIRSIDLKREFSFVEVEKRVAERVLKSLKGAKLHGRKIEARLAA
jgi:superfamily II DNA/RNA helicase